MVTLNDSHLLLTFGLSYFPQCPSKAQNFVNYILHIESLTKIQKQKSSITISKVLTELSLDQKRHLKEVYYFKDYYVNLKPNTLKQLESKDSETP